MFRVANGCCTNYYKRVGPDGYARSGLQKTSLLHLLTCDNSDP
ncbi:hypothetical protein BGLA2_1390038 [Burkholderia gladioli]|nr:hypothetical protein BGLA2_1390038 [Burkholderia gladioli]